MGLGFWYGAELIATGAVNERTGEAFSGGDVMKVFFCLLLGFFGVGQLAPWIQAYSEAKPWLLVLKKMEGAERPLVTEGGRVVSRADVEELFAFAGGKTETVALEARNLCFSYPTRPDVRVLENVNFTVKCGQKVAFVGESGSGKSTIVQLIERFYDSTSPPGSLMIGGVGVRDWGFAALGQALGYVQQQPVLFDCSVRENLVLGLDAGSVSDADLQGVLEKTKIWDAISALPDGLETRCGGSGAHYSGGQRQRIAIARALLRSPKILLLDEATSALDYRSEREVQETIDSLSRDASLTVVIVAHRLSTVRSCDQIIFLTEGGISERGRHEELAGLQGGYFKLVETQNALSGAEAAARQESKEEAAGGAVIGVPAEQAVVAVAAAGGGGGDLARLAWAHRRASTRARRGIGGRAALPSSNRPGSRAWSSAGESSENDVSTEDALERAARDGNFMSGARFGLMSCHELQSLCAKCAQMTYPEADYSGEEGKGHGGAHAVGPPSPLLSRALFLACLPFAPLQRETKTSHFFPRFLASAAAPYHPTRDALQREAKTATFLPAISPLRGCAVPPDSRRPPSANEICYPPARPRPRRTPPFRISACGHGVNALGRDYGRAEAQSQTPNLDRLNRPLPSPPPRERPTHNSPGRALSGSSPVATARSRK